MKFAVKSTARRFVLTRGEDQMQRSRLIQSLVQNRIRWELPCVCPLYTVCICWRSQYACILCARVSLCFSWLFDLQYLEEKRSDYQQGCFTMLMLRSINELLLSLQLSTKVFHRIFDRMLAETNTHISCCNQTQTITCLLLAGAFIQNKSQLIWIRCSRDNSLLVIYSKIFRLNFEIWSLLPTN